MQTLYKKLVRKLPYVKEIFKEYSHNHVVMPFPAGHYYNPVNDFDYIGKNKTKIFDLDQPVQGIDLNTEGQMALLEKFKTYHDEIPFTHEKSNAFRYYFNNEFYTYSDAIMLYSFMREFKPKRIIEIGSGFTSALMLDTNQKHFDGSIDLSFIEPYPDRLKSLLGASEKMSLHEAFVQDVPLDIYDALEEHDILFVDSSHVMKTGSDLWFILFQILPRLKKGVHIHFHDIYHPFEYPEKWVMDMKLSWNEIYLLRAFLMHNDAFKIRMFNTQMEYQQKTWFETNMPKCLKSSQQTSSGSLWIEKVQ